MDMSPEEAVDYVRTKKGALDSACWFWDTNGLNKYCDAMDIQVQQNVIQWRNYWFR